MFNRNDVEYSLDVCLLHDVGFNIARSLPEALGERIAFVNRSPGENHMCTVFYKQLGGRFSDTASPACDNGNFA